MSSTATTTTTIQRARRAARVRSAPVAPPAATSAARGPATVATRSATSTGSSAQPAGKAPAVNVADGVLSGVLSPTFDVADLPMQGPGSWTLTGSAALQAQLACPSHTGEVQGQVVISGAQRCELQLTSTYQGATTWQLTPTA